MQIVQCDGNRNSRHDYAFSAAAPFPVPACLREFQIPKSTHGGLPSIISGATPPAPAAQTMSSRPSSKAGRALL